MAFLETCFILSLGITFVLILLVVYRTNARIHVLENGAKSTSVVIETIVREMNFLGDRDAFGPFQPGFSRAPDPPQWCAESLRPHDVSLPADARSTPLPSLFRAPVGVVDYAHSTCDDSETETESEFDADSDAESDSESETYAAFYTNNANFLDTPRFVELEGNAISVFIEDDAAADPFSTSKEEEEEEAKIIPDQNILVEILDVAISEETPELEGGAGETPEKGDVSGATLRDAHATRESYRKMSIHELKMLAISEAGCVDPSKMKKPDLVKMLISR